MSDLLVGKRIVEVRAMSPREMADRFWRDNYHGLPVVLVLEDGTKVIPAKDHEFNEPGAIEIETVNGDAYSLVVGGGS